MRVALVDDAAFERPKALPARWRPNPGPQQEFYDSTAHEVLFGGAAGGGKSAGAVALPLRWVDNGSFRALILRRETTQLQDLWDKANDLYRREYPEAKCNSTTHTWTFPSGAVIRFAHCKDPNDAFDYQGHEYHLVEFDELTQFLFMQYREIKSRVRGTDPRLPRYIRATTNPGGKGHEWVFSRWGPWLNPDFVADGLPPRFCATTGKKLPPARPGQVLWVTSGDDGDETFSTTRVEIEGEEAPTRTFIPARLSDNPHLTANDPGYRARLRDNSAVRRRQLEDGDWLVKPSAGLYFKREWFEFVDAVPPGIPQLRCWDKAATEPSKSNPDPDWTAGVKLALAPDGYLYIANVTRTRGGPGHVLAHQRATAELDGRGVAQRGAQDPGQAGKVDVAAVVKALEGFDYKSKPESGDKVTRAGALSSLAHPQSTGGVHGKVRIVRGAWNDAFISELEDFPEGEHDDQVDAASNGYAWILELPRPAARGVITTPLY